MGQPPVQRPARPAGPLLGPASRWSSACAAPRPGALVGPAGRRDGFPDIELPDHGGHEPRHHARDDTRRREPFPVDRQDERRSEARPEPGPREEHEPEDEAVLAERQEHGGDTEHQDDDQLDPHPGLGGPVEGAGIQVPGVKTTCQALGNRTLSNPSWTVNGNH